MTVLYGPGERVIRQVRSSIYTDTSVEDGFFDVTSDPDDLDLVRGRTVYLCSPLTYEVLTFHGLIGSVLDELDKRGSGTHLIPPRLLDPDAAEDTRRAVDLVSSYEDIGGMSSYEDIAQCVLPTCQQQGTDLSRGFPLCQLHDGLMRDWDDLTSIE